MKTLLTTILGGAALLASAAQAGTIYSYDGPARIQNTSAGTISDIQFQYDTDEEFSFSATLDNNSSNGGWFVVSGGSNPKGTDTELAIFYLDYAGGDVYAYRYNGANSAASFSDPDRFITSYEDVLSVETSGSSTTVSFNELDVSSFGAGTFGADWTGAAFGEQIGIWAHFTALDSFAVVDGKISEFVVGTQSWYDSNYESVDVPEPVGLAALGMLGVVGFAAYRRRKAAA